MVEVVSVVEIVVVVSSSKTEREKLCRKTVREQKEKLYFTVQLLIVQ